MSKRVVLIGPEQLEAIAKVVAFASLPENLYDPDERGRCPPGDDPRHVVHVPVGVRCVFSISWIRYRNHRHLSISVDDRTALPNLLVSFDLAEAFGFTGYDRTRSVAPKDWLYDANETEGTFVLLQRL